MTLLNDEMVKEINSIVLAFGHVRGIKKKETAPLRLKTDSFVVESNVHFPTDYNLLWDSVRKCIDTVCTFLDKYKNLKGWWKIKNWKAELKGLMRELGKTTASGGEGKEQRGVCAYNLKKIGAKLLEEDEREKLRDQKSIRKEA